MFFDQEAWGQECTIHPFGSSASGLGNASSDLDVEIACAIDIELLASRICGSEDTETKIDDGTPKKIKTPEQRLVSAMQLVFVGDGGNYARKAGIHAIRFSDVLAIDTARVPVYKMTVTFPDRGIVVQVSIDSLLSFT